MHFVSVLIVADFFFVLVLLDRLGVSGPGNPNWHCPNQIRRSSLIGVNHANMIKYDQDSEDSRSNPK